MTNWAAIGYAILALRRIGIEEALISVIVGVMFNVMDECTEHEAEEAYRNL